MVSRMNNEDVILPVDSVPQYQPIFEVKSTSSDVVLPVDIKPNTEVQYFDSLDVDPNHAAKVVSISNKLKESPLYVNDNLAQAEKIAQAPKSDFFKKLEERYPGTSKFLLRGANMAIAKDDIDNLAWYEDVVGQATKGYKIGALNVEQATLAKDQILEALATGQVPTIHEEKLQQLEAQMEKDNQNPDGFKPVFWASQQVPNFGLMAQYAGANALIGGAVGATAGTIVPGVGTTAGAVVGISTGATMGLIEASAVLEGGNAFREYIKLKDKNGNPIDPKLAAGAALVAGGINAGLELVTLKALAKTIPGADKAIGYFTKDIPILNKLTPGKAVISAVKDYLVAMGTEAATEVTQEAVTGVTAQALQGEFKPGELGERVSQVINPAVQSAFLFGLPGTGMRIAGNLGKVRQASNDKQVYLDLGNAAKQSKLKERLPEGHSEFQVDVTKDTPIENVYLPVDKFESYFQDKKIDPATVAKELGVEVQYNKAKETGGDVQVPTATWVDKVVGTEHYQGLANDVKFTPEGLTVNETVEAKAQIEEALKTEQTKAQELIDQDATRRAGYDEVYNYIKNEQTNSPKPEGITVNDWSKTIDNNAKLWAAHAVAESARQGKSVQEWFQGINRPTVAQEQMQGQVAGQELSQSTFVKPETYSQIENTIKNELPANASTEEVRQALRMLSPNDLKYSGIDTFLTGKETVNKTELMHYLQNQKMHFNRGKTLFQSATRPTEDINYERVKKLGYTENINEVGYLTTDGQFIDLSGKNEGGSPNTRALDHREVGGTNGMVEFVNQGNIRLMPESGGIDIRQALTNEQETALINYINHFNGKVIVDLQKGIGEYSKEIDGYKENPGVLAKEYDEGTKATKVINDIKNYYQEGQTLLQGERGKLNLTPDQSVITLFKNADQSTFIHESGHLWLKDTLNFIQSGKASEQYQADWNTLKEWLKITDDQKEFTTEQQEQFARGFESYLMEGKAPSEGLKSVFAQFKRWLTRIYRNITGLNVELTDPVRKVMDRMVATEDEIAQAESQSNFMSSIDFKDVPPEVQKKLTTLRERAKEKAERTLLKEQMQELTKEYEKQYNDKLAQVTKEEQAIVNDMPIYATMRQIGTEFKKNPTLLADNYIQKKMKPETEARFNVIAELSGFTSGDELAQTIKQTKKSEDTVKERVANRMQEFAPLKDQAIIKQKALEAIHNNYSLELLASERELLNEMIKGELTAQQKRKTNAELTQNKLKLIKEQARNTLLNTPVKDLSRFSVYYTAERNAAVKSAKAFAKGDIAESLKYKDQQLLNHALATESSKLRKAIDRSVAYLKSQQTVNRDTFKKSEHLYQAAALLRRFGFERGDFTVDLRNESLSQWAERMQQVTNIVDLPDWILDETKGFQDFRELTFDQLHEVAGAIKNIKKVASMEDRVYSFGNKVTMSEVVNDLVKSQRESGKSGKTPELSLKEDWTQKVIKRKDSVKFSLLNTETLLRGLDKYKTFGNWWNTFYKPINEAANEKVKMLTEASLKYRNIFEVYSKIERQEMAEKKIFIQELNNSLTKNEILAMALNWGNEINRKRLIEGRGWNEGQITTILNKYLDKRDWDTVQNTWDLINSYWGQISGLYEELTGFAPTKVEATSITTKYGVYKGGYYPLKSDPRSSVRGFQEMAVDAALAESANPTWKAMTKNGHTKERTANAKYAVSLDLTVIARHLHDVIHDITHRKAIIDINRLLANQDVQNAVIDAYGMEGLQTLKNWEKALAGDNPQQSLDFWQKLAGWSRRNTVVVAMGMRLSTMFQQFTGFFSTVAVDKNYGWTDMATSVWDYYGKNIFSPGYYRESLDFVKGKSAYMKDRVTTLDRDISDTARNVFGQKNRMSEFAMSGISFFDRLVTIPTWMRAYSKGLEIYKGDEAKSIQWADYIVRRSQGSGMMKDLPAMMRGSEGQKLFTMFYSYMNTQLNLFYENTDQVHSTKDLPTYMGRMMALLILPVVFSELLAFRAPLDDDESDEEKLKFWLSKIIQYPFALFPVVRDIADVAVDEIVGIKGFGYRPTPAAGAVDALINTVKKLKSDRTDTTQKLESVTKLGSYLVPYPDQFNAWFWNVSDYLFNDMNPRVSDIVRRRPKRERNE